jgi:hypothetical protein
MDAILATPLMLGRELAIVPIAHSQQVIPISAFSPNVSCCVTPPITNGLNDVNYCYNFKFRLPKNAVFDTYTTHTSSNYLVTPASQNTSFFVVQFDDPNSDGAVDFKHIVIFAPDCAACYSSMQTHTRAIDFGKINFKVITLFVHRYIIYWST